MKTDITFTTEILNRTARELNVDPRTIKYLYKFCIDYLHKQIQSTDCCAFELPYVGTMYIENDFLINEIQNKISESEKDPDNTELRKRKLALEHKKKAIDIYTKNSNRPVSHSHHFKRNRLKNNRYTLGKTIEELQEIQNNIYNKNKDLDV